MDGPFSAVWLHWSPRFFLVTVPAPLSIDFPGYWLSVGCETPSQFRRRAELQGVPESLWPITYLRDVRPRCRWVYL